MCEFCKEYQGKGEMMLNLMAGQYPHCDDFLIKHVMRVQPSVCPMCGKHLTHEEMNPKDHCTRSLCNRCYDTHVVHTELACLVCGGSSSSHYNSREPSDKLCSPECKAVWTMMHCGVLNNPSEVYMFINGLRNIHNGQDMPDQVQEIVVPDIIDVECEDVTPQKSVGPGQRAITHGSTQTLNEWMQQGRKPIHESAEDNVIYVTLPGTKRIG